MLGNCKTFITGKIIILFDILYKNLRNKAAMYVYI